MSYEGYGQWGYAPYYNPSSQQSAPAGTHSQQPPNYRPSEEPYSPYQALPSVRQGQQVPLFHADPRQLPGSSAQYQPPSAADGGVKRASQQDNSQGHPHAQREDERQYQQGLYGQSTNARHPGYGYTQGPHSQPNRASSGPGSWQTPSTNSGQAQRPQDPRFISKDTPRSASAGAGVVSPNTYQPNTGRSISSSHPPQISPASNSGPNQELRRLQSSASQPSYESQHSKHDAPVTVDPSHIFDQDQYLRRCIAAEETSQAWQEPLKGQASEAPTALDATTSSHHSRSGSASRSQLEAEMKTMIEKMKGYKAVDPAMFSAVWEQLKKDQPPLSASSEPSGHDALTDLGKFPAMRRRERNDKGKSRSSGKEPPGIQSPTDALANIRVQTESSSTRGQAAPLHLNASFGGQGTPPEAPASGDHKTQQHGKTVWPEGKRVLLAETAVRALRSDPRNAGRTITAPEVLDFLSKNPTYDQLCEVFYKGGFVFGKAIFARTLLSAMAGDPVQDNARKRKLEISQEQQNKRVKVAAPAKPQASGKDDLDPSIKIQQSLGAGQSTQANLGMQPGGQVTGEMIAADIQPAAPPAPPVKPTKEAMARKQNFNDLVDLTILDESDDDQPPPMSGHSLISSALNEHQADTQPFYRAPPHMSDAGPSRQFDRYGALNKAAAIPVQKSLLAQPFETKKALRRSAYNPATIARDFLIAKGEHPTQRPLNQHLEILMVNYKEQVTHKTDLASFRWDLVDPGDPVDEHGNLIRLPKPPSRGGIDAAEVLPTGLGGDGATLSPSPLQTHTANPPPPVLSPPLLQTRTTNRPPPALTPTRGHALAKRGRPRGRPPTRPRASLPERRTEGESTEDRVNVPGSTGREGVGVALAAARRGGLARPTTPARNAPQNPAENSFIDDIMPTFVAINQDVFKKPAYLENAYPSQPASQLSTPVGVLGALPSHPITSPLASSAAAPRPPAKKRGRPPKNVPPASSATATSSPGSGPARRGRPPGSKNSPFARKPGRPPKSQPGKVNTTMPDDGVGVMIQSRSPSSTPASVSYIEDRPEQKPKPKRWKSRPTYPTETPDSDAFVSFKCRWIGCKAELHNLDTLRKHVFKVHREKCFSQEAQRFSCFWDACDAIDAFSNADLWEQHIGGNHIEALARQLGDGPTTHPAEIGLGYLTDASGRRVTPLVRTSGTPDPLPLYAGRSPTKAYHKAHGNMTPEARVRAEAASLRFHALRAAEARREGRDVNKTAEWRSDSNASGSNSDTESSDGDEMMTG